MSMKLTFEVVHPVVERARIKSKSAGAQPEERIGLLRETGLHDSCLIEYGDATVDHLQNELLIDREPHIRRKQVAAA
jgi:hypothetical protein